MAIDYEKALQKAKTRDKETATVLKKGGVEGRSGYTNSGEFVAAGGKDETERRNKPNFTLESLMSDSGRNSMQNKLGYIRNIENLPKAGIPTTPQPSALKTFAPTEATQREDFLDFRDEMAGQKKESIPLNINLVPQENLDSTARQTILAKAHKDALKSFNFIDDKDQPVPFMSRQQQTYAPAEQEKPTIPMKGAYNTGTSHSIPENQPNRNEGFVSKNFWKGASGANNAIMSTLDWILPNELAGRYDALEPVFNYYRDIDASNQLKVDAVNDTKVKEITGQLISGTVQALPSAILALASAGTSIIGQAVGTGIANANKVSTLGTALQGAVKELGKNPMFWTSFLQMAGPTYEEEIANGANEVQASASAMLNGILGSAIEVSGGLETFKWADKGWKKLLTTALEEGGEEVSQYSLQNLINKAIGSNTAKWGSLNPEESAVINPLAQLEQGAYGAAIGGILGGGQQAFVSGANKANDIRNREGKIPVIQPDGRVKYQNVSTSSSTTDSYVFDVLGISGDYNNLDNISEMNMGLYSKAEEAFNIMDEINTNGIDSISEEKLATLRDNNDLFKNAINNRFVVEVSKPYYDQISREIDKILAPSNTYRVTDKAPIASVQPQAPDVSVTEPIQTETPLKNIGKKQGNNVSIHKSYESSISGDSIAQAKQKVGDFDYDIVRINDKTGDISFIRTDDFDSKTEPEIVSVITVKKDGAVIDETPEGKIIVDKAKYVSDDYADFDVAAAKDREAAWRKAGVNYDSTQIDSRDYFENHLKNVGLLSTKNEIEVDNTVDIPVEDETVATPQSEESMSNEETLDTNPKTGSTDSPRPHAASKEEGATEAKQESGTNKNVGVHFGDLGKTEYLMTMNGSRGTGHFGTGTYFVSAESDAIPRMTENSYGKRPRHEVSFDGYNLYRPKDVSQGRKLHEFLKQVNKWAYGNDNYRDSIADMYNNNLNLFDNVFTSEGEIEEYLTELQNYAAENKQNDEKAYFDKTERYDSPSTKFMEYLGYEGVDVRGLKGLDDEEFGSVIYDLKQEQRKEAESEKDAVKVSGLANAKVDDYEVNKSGFIDTVDKDTISVLSNEQVDTALESVDAKLDELQEENDGQTIVSSLETTITETEAIINEAEKATEEQIDEQLNKIDEVLKEYKLPSEIFPSKKAEANEIASKAAHVELKKELTNFSKALAETMGYEFDTDNKGKTTHASVGFKSGTIILWKPNTDYGIYISINYEEVPQDKEYNWNSSLKMQSLITPAVLYRVATRKNKYSGFTNNFLEPKEGILTVSEIAPLVKDIVDRQISYDERKNKKEIDKPIKKGNIEIEVEKETEKSAEENVTGKGEENDGGNIRRPVRGNGTEALEGASTEDVSKAPEVGGTGEKTPGGERADAQGNGRTDEQGSGGGSGLGDRKGEVRHTPDGRGPANPVDKIPDKIISEKEKITNDPRGQNAVITKEIELGNDKQRFSNNIAAIKLVKQLETEQRKATLKEQQILLKYVGWGGLSNAFNNYNREWQNEYEELKTALTDDEYKAARSSTLNAHYTSIGVIKAMYKGLEKLGFKGGRMLEPASGIGHFIGAMPTEMSESVKSWTAVELDPITGLIAKHLYPRANVKIEGFEKSNIADNFIDVAIGNVPFGNFGVTDSKYPKHLTAAIHNYFFAKALDKVRPGGIVMFITSRYTLDSKSSAVRKSLYEKADLLGAIRLPNSAFKSNAGTEVVTDIIVLRKRAQGEEKSGAKFIDTVEKQFGENAWQKSDINEYFAKNPKMMLGVPATGRGMYSYNEFTLNPSESKISLEKQIEKAFNNIKGAMTYETVNFDEIKEAVRREIAPDGTKENEFVVQDGKVYQNQQGELVEYKLKNAAQESRIKGIIEVKVALKDLLRSMADGDPDAVKEKHRAKLNKVYDTFVKKHGEINSIANSGAFREDPDYYLMRSIENYDKTTKAATKTDIFTKDTIEPVRNIEKVDTAKESLIVSLNEFGRVVPQRMAELTGKTQETVLEELIADGLIFKNAGGNYEIAELYLSGNVKEKMKEAEAMLESDPSYQANVEALKTVIPPDIPLSKIRFSIGSTWVPNEVYEAFLQHLFNSDYTSFKVNYIVQTGSWVIEQSGRDVRSSAEAQTVWGTSYKNAWDIVDAAFNNKDVRVTYKDEDGKTITLQSETLAAKEKLELVKQEFEKWAKEDETVSGALADLYNEEFNNIALPNYDGSHVEIVGMNPAKKLRPHQLDAVWRIVSSGGNTLLAHKVGAGKSGEMAGGAMMLRQLGIVKKPMFVVPNHLVEQWGSEFLSFFPAAKILVATKNDFKKENRKVFLNKIAMGDYDAVIVAESSFGFISMSPSYVQRFYGQQIDELELAIQALVEAGQRKSPSVKDLEKAKKKLTEKMNKKLESLIKDSDVLTFEELGVDSLFVDEAHIFKNLFYASNMRNVSGLGSPEGNNKTFDLYMKTSYLQQLNGGRGVVFATATPVMNSMSEMYTMQRYLQPDMLRSRRLTSFDAWANVFGDVITLMEMTPEGRGYRQKQAFSKFKNVGELVQMFRSFADVLLDIPGIEVPKATKHTVSAQPSDFQKKYIDELADRADAVRTGRVDPKDDNMLKITSEGRKLALDQRIINPSAPDNPRSKLNMAVDNIFEIWADTKKDSLTQLVFADLSTPKGEKKGANSGDTSEDGIPAGEEDFSNTSVYDDIRRKLVARGIPIEEIAFIHEANTEARRESLFAAMNAGRVRILIGSTGKMGVGMNVQRKMIALHHLDAPWRPGDIEQREGRMIRQGNENGEVHVYTYVTEATFDARMWDNLQRKAEFINQIMTSGTDVREAEDIGELAISFAEIKAIASGNPLIQEQFEVEAEYRKLIRLKANHESERANAKWSANRAKNRIEHYTEKIKDLKSDLATRQDTTGDNFTIVIDGKSYTKREEAGKAITEYYRGKFYEKTGFASKSIEKFGSFAGFDILMQGGSDIIISGKYSRTARQNVDSPAGTIQSMEAAVRSIEGDIKYYERGLEDEAKNLPKFEEAASKEFDKEDRLQEVSQRRAEILEELQLTDDSSTGDDVDSGIDSSDSEYQNATASSITGQFYKPSSSTTAQNAITPEVAKGPIKPISQIIVEISKAFGTPITSKRYSGRKSLGRYNTKYSFIETKYANTIGVVSHELGHHFDKVYSILKNHKEELKYMANKMEPEVKKAYKPQDLPAEAMAEFMRLYLIDPQGAYEFTELENNRNFYDIFESMINESDMQKLKAVRGDILNFLAASVEEQAKTTIHPYGEKFKTSVEEKRMSIYSEWVNGYESFEVMNRKIKELTGKEVAPSDNAYYLALQSQRGDVLAHRLVHGRLVDLQGNVIGDGFASLYKSIKKKERADFDLYLKLVHALDWMDQGKMVFSPDYSRSDIEAAINRLEARYPHFSTTANSLYEWWDKFVRAWLVDTGFMEAEVYETMHEMYPHYVPNFRMEDGVINTAGGKKAKSGFSNQTNPVKRASEKGNARDTYSATQSMIMEIDRYVKSVLRRDVMLALHRNYHNTDYAEVMGDFMRKVPPEKQRHVYNATDMKSNLKGDLFMNEIDRLSPEERAKFEKLSTKEQIKYFQDSGIDMTIDNVIDDYIVFYTPKKISTDESIVTVVDNGRTFFYEVFDKYMAQALTNLGPQELNGVIKILAEIKRAMTIMTTGGNPIFGLTSNIFRDVPQAYVMGKYVNPIEFAWALVDATKSVLLKDEKYQKYKDMGGGFESPIGADARYIKKTLRQMPGGNTGVLNKVGSIVDFIEEINNLIETVPRLTEFNKYMQEGGDTYDNRLESMYRSADVTLNFQRKGSGGVASTLVQVIPFFNAGIQGIDKFYRGVWGEKENRKGVIIKSLAMISLFSIAQALSYANDDDYDELPEFYKNNYWLFKYAPGKFFRIPKARELSVLFGVTFERAIREALHSEEDNGKALLMAFKDNFLVPTSWVLAPVYDAMANRTWSGGNIVSQRDEVLMTDGYYNEVYDDTTSRIAVLLAKMLPDVDSLGAINTPKGIEYLIKQYTGGLGQIILPATTPSSEGPVAGIQRKMTVDVAYSSKYVDEFYRAKAKLDAAQRVYKDRSRMTDDYNDQWRLAFQRFNNGFKSTANFKDVQLPESAKRILGGEAGYVGLSKKWAEIRMINNDDSLTAEEKHDKIREVRLEINDVTKQLMEAYNKDTKK
ncbi:MAG: hypothetical protein PHE79_08715 [Eubacteriales bacterium]|nr:hypothetical protein [Eubacteriales bacterium]